MSYPYVVFIQWDDQHTSPPIGPFRNLSRGEAFMRDFRKKWRKLNDRRPVNGKPCPKLYMRVLHSPEAAINWSE